MTNEPSISSNRDKKAYKTATHHGLCNLLHKANSSRSCDFA